MVLRLSLSAKLLSRSFFHSSTMALTATISIPRLNKDIAISTGLFINNEFVPSVDSQELIQSVFILPKDKFVDRYSLSAINPATEELICSVVAGIYNPSFWLSLVTIRLQRLQRILMSQLPPHAKRSRPHGGRTSPDLSAPGSSTSWPILSNVMLKILQSLKRSTTVNQ